MTFDITPGTEPAPAGVPAANSRPPGYFWTTSEVALIRQLYPADGAAAVAAALPHRSLSSIHGKAQTMGLRAPKRAPTAGMEFARIYPNDPSIDEGIRRVYTTATRKGEIKEFAAKIGRPAWWVQRRACKLGVTRTVRTRVDRWTDAEMRIVEDHASCMPKVIAQKLRRAGFERTPTAVAVALKRRGIDTSDPDRWTADGLAKLLGVTGTAVRDWIERRGLRATRRSDKPGSVWLISRQELRRWVGSHQRFIDLRKVDQVWFMDIAFGGAT